MPSWVDSHFAAGFFLGCCVAIIVYVLDWLWHVKRRPKPGKPYDDRTVTAALKENERRDRADKSPTPPPSPPLTASALHPRPVDPLDVEEDLRLDTADLPMTQEHPAPSTALIDMSQPPPQLPYRGPERRLRSDNPYPELRRRADDRERQEAEAALLPPKATPPPPRLTRAEERRRREAGDTHSDGSNTESE